MHLITTSYGPEIQVCLLSLLLWFGHSWVSRAGKDFQSGLVWKGNEVSWKAHEPQIHYGYGVHLCLPIKKVFCFYKHPRFLLGMLRPHAHTLSSHEAGWEHAHSKGRLNPRICAKNTRKDTTFLLQNWHWKDFGPGTSVWHVIMGKRSSLGMSKPDERELSSTEKLDWGVSFMGADPFSSKPKDQHWVTGTS